MRKAIFAAALAAMLCGGGAAAHAGGQDEGSAGGDPLYDACIAESDGTNSAWAVCGGEMVARADARLNAVWKRVYGAMPEDAKPELLAAQRAWIAYKDKACRHYYAPGMGREGQVIGAPACLTGIIEDRTETLESFVCDMEGDISCVYAPVADEAE